MSRPLPLTILGALQFVGFAVACVVLLGDGTLDGALTTGDVVRAVAVALLGALVVGSTWSGGRLGWWFDLALGTLLAAWGAITTVTDEPPGYPMLATGVLWLAVVLLPSSRDWFLRELPD